MHKRASHSRDSWNCETVQQPLALKLFTVRRTPANENPFARFEEEDDRDTDGVETVALPRSAFVNDDDLSKTASMPALQAAPPARVSSPGPFDVHVESGVRPRQQSFARLSHSELPAPIPLGPRFRVNPIWI